MKPSDLRLALGCAAAVVVPAAVLHFTADAERLAAGLTASPFGWFRVLAVHLLGALPLGVIVASRVRAVPAANDVVRGLWVVIGLAVAGLAAMVCPGIGEAVSGGEFGALPLLVLRAALSFGLVLPWCVWATDPPAKSDARPLAKPGLVFALGVGFAVLPGGLYAEAVVAARTEQALDLTERERTVRAHAVLTGLVELGSDRPIGKKPPAEVLKRLSAAIPRLRQAADRPLPANAPLHERIGRVVTLIQVDRLDEAAALLTPLASNDQTAALLLASVYRDQERRAESDELFSRVLDEVLPRASIDAAARQRSFVALEGLAFNATQDGRPADAERVLKRGLEALPEQAAYFHFQLGSHYANAGRPGLAIDHLRTAAALDPARYGERADRLVRQLQTATPACFTWRSP